MEVNIVSNNRDVWINVYEINQNLYGVYASLFAKERLAFREPAVLWSGHHAALQQPAGPPGLQHINSDHGAVIRMSPDEVFAPVQVEGHVQSRWHVTSVA